MISHSQILSLIGVVRERERKLSKTFRARQIDREGLLQFEYRAGQAVTDLETGQEGEVIHVTRKRITKVQGS